MRSCVDFVLNANPYKEYAYTETDGAGVLISRNRISEPPFRVHLIRYDSMEHVEGVYKNDRLIADEPFWLHDALNGRSHELFNQFYYTSFTSHIGALQYMYNQARFDLVPIGPIGLFSLGHVFDNTELFCVAQDWYGSLAITVLEVCCANKVQ